MMNLLLPMLKRHEGLRLVAYQCTEGVWTIGYGHTGPEVQKGLTITKEQADHLLINDLETSLKDASSLNYYHTLSPARKAVIVNMLFNLGINRFKGFKRFNLAMSKGQYDLASQEMLLSKWADQVGARAKELSRIIKTDKI